MNYKIRNLEKNDIPKLVDFPPAYWNFNIIEFFEFYYGKPFFYSIVIEKNNEIIGCAECFLNGNSSWLGMIIVREDHRRKNIGTELTEHLIEYSRNKNINSIALTATNMGKELYLKLGFEIVSKYIFYKRDSLADYKKNDKIRTIEGSDFEEILELDRKVSGEDRKDVLQLLVENGYAFWDKNEIQGFFLPRIGNGVIITGDDEAGIELLKFKHTNYNKMTAVPEENTVAKDFLIKNGFEQYNDSLRMVLGKKIDWKPERIFCRISGYLS